MKVKFKRIVIKVGSSTLTNLTGILNLERIEHLVEQLVELKRRGREVLLVTSGAIAAGMKELGLKERPSSIPEQQGAAAVGQGLLIEVYNRFLKKYGERGAQILLTSSDFQDRKRYLNSYNTIDTLLKYGVLPIINENDTVATQEIKFGDNDTLSARVASLVEANLLIILSDVEGLYNGNPRDGKDNNLIRKVDIITPEIEKMVGGRGSPLGTGGMVTKLRAAKIVLSSGITMVIGPGYRKGIILNIIDSIENEDYQIGTTFIPEGKELNKRKQWLSYNLPAVGTIIVDRGAEEALLYQGKSLLPGGIITVKGKFSRGDSVDVANSNGKIVGKGLVNYSSDEIEKIKGYHSKKIYSILGYYIQEEVIHRDDFVLKGGIDYGY